MNEWAGVLLDYTQDKVAVLDEEGRFQYLNRATERILGYEPDTLVGEVAIDYVHPEDRSAVHETFADLRANHGEVRERTVTFRHRTADGSWVWMESRVSSVTEPTFGGYVVSSRDVTARVTAERERDETARRLDEIAASSADVLWMFNADWDRLLFINDAYETVYGGSVDRLEENPRRFLERVHPDDIPVVRSAMDRVSDGETVDIEYRVGPGKDYATWVRVHAVPIAEDGEVARIAGFTRDVTDRRRRERQLVVIDNVLRHNLRNDLNTVLGNVERILEDPVANAPECAETVRRTGCELLEKAEKQRETIRLLTTPDRPIDVDLDDAIRTAISDVHDRFPAAEVTVDVPDPFRARALPEIQSALAELLENAAKHVEDVSPRIRIAGRVADDEVVLEIRDNCPRIPDYEYRVLTGEERMNDVYHSSGLGLWLVYWTVDLSDGRIEFFANGDAGDAGSGNLVTISLPAADDG